MTTEAALVEAIENLLSQCVVVHRHWGAYGNQKETDAAVSALQEALANSKENCNENHVNRAD